MKVIAIVGMTGSGKTELAGMMEKEGYHKIRFGDITEEKIKEAGLQVNEKNERYIREKLRKDHGMAAYAILNEPKITKALKKSDVVADGLYSWEEYLYLKEKFGNRLIVLAVYSPPSLRHKWLGKRPVRPLTPEEAQSRDKSEIEKIALLKKDQLGISDGTEKGALMSALMKDLRGKADGAVVKEVVDSLF